MMARKEPALYQLPTVPDHPGFEPVNASPAERAMYLAQVAAHDYAKAERRKLRKRNNSLLAYADGRGKDTRKNRVRTDRGPSKATRLKHNTYNTSQQLGPAGSSRTPRFEEGTLGPPHAQALQKQLPTLFYPIGLGP